MPSHQATPPPQPTTSAIRMGVPIIDSHAHIDFPAFDPDREAMLSRMHQAGVSDVICIATDLTGYPRQRALAESAPNIWFTTGLHPCYVTDATLATPNSDSATSAPSDSTSTATTKPNPNPTDPSKAIATLTTQLKTNTTHPRCVAIGEAGLDYYRNAAHKQAQHDIFAMQLKLATETNLPIIIHARDADADMEAMLVKATSQGTLTGVMHCFSSGAQLAEKALEIGFYISFSGIVTFKGDKTKALRDIACAVPQDRLLVETDAPYLTPEPVRAIKRNEPAHVVHILTYLAELRGEATDELAQATAANTRRLFWRMQAQ